VDLRANVTAAERLIEHYESAWATRAPGAGEGTEEIYFLERPRISQDVIATRTRTGGLHAEREWGARHTSFVAVAWSDFDDDFYRNRLELNTGRGALVAGSAEVAPGATTQVAGDYAGGGARRYFASTLTARDILRLQAGGRVKGDGWEVDYAVYHATWRSVARTDAWNFFDRNLDLAYTIDAPYFPAVAVTNGVDLGDTSRARFNDRRVGPTRTRDEDWAGRVDLERRMAWAGGTAWWGAGVLHREKERSNSTNTRVFFGNAAAPLTLADVDYASAPGRVVQGFYDLPAGLDPAAGREAGDGGGPEFVLSEARAVIESAQTAYTTAEEVQAAYASGTWRRGGWEVAAGLRGERTATASLGTVISPVATDDGVGEQVGAVVDNGTPVVIRRVPGGNDYSTTLPSVAVGYTFSPRWAVRATAHEQVMRPQYFDIVRYRRVHPPTLSLTEGNPNLRPTTIRSLATAVDYTTARFGEIAAEVYWVEVTDFFYSAQDFELIDGALYTASRVENGDEGKIHGFQVQWSQTWRTAGVGTWRPAVGYVYSDSEATVPTRPADRLWLPERSRHLLRTALGWESAGGKWGAGAELTSQSVALDEVGPSLERDGYRDTVFALGVNTWWRPTVADRVTLALNNLTNAPERSYEGEPRRATRNQYSTMTARLGWERRF
jgi:TonB-dependent receptor